MKDRVFRKIYELRDHVEAVKFSIENCKAAKNRLERDISSMSFELRERKLELERRMRAEARDKVDSAQRELDILDGKEAGPPKKVPAVCGRRCPSGYMSPCSYDRGHSGACEGQYDEEAALRRLERST